MRILLILLGIVLTVQLTGCFYEGHDDRWHHDHDRSYHPEQHDPAVDVHFHG